MQLDTESQCYELVDLPKHPNYRWSHRDCPPGGELPRKARIVMSEQNMAATSLFKYTQNNIKYYRQPAIHGRVRGIRD